MTIPTSSQTVRGRIEQVFFSRPDFSAGKLRTSAGLNITFAGKIFVRPHEAVVFTGVWKDHPRYGHQFQVESLEYDLKLDHEGLAHYLANNPDIMGIGPAKAKLIAEHFGDDFDQAILNRPEDIALTVKVSRDTIFNLREQWIKHREMNQVFTWLASFELTHHQISKLVDRYHANVVSILKANPYLMVRDIRGFGFKRVDKIALKMGIPKNHPERVKAGILHCIEEALDQGHCWINAATLFDEAMKVLIMDADDSGEKVNEGIRQLVEDGALSKLEVDRDYLYAKPRILEMEEYLFDLFLNIGGGRVLFPELEDPFLTVSIEADDLNQEQQKAVVNALTNTGSLIAGGAGSGKTFTVKAIAKFCHRRGKEFLLAAPTGKAAKRLEQMVGFPASTIHRLLGYNGETFSVGPDNPLSADLVIIDECSMIDIPLAWQLFQAIDPFRTAIVLVGDHNQLPPVGPGNLMRDLTKLQLLPTTILDKVVRQAGLLKENSIAILQGKVHPSGPNDEKQRRVWYVRDNLRETDEVRAFLRSLYREFLKERLGYDLTTDVQVLTPTHKGPLGTEALNIELQRIIQAKCHSLEVPPVRDGAKPEFLLHDKVIQTKNNYKLGVMNGTIGIIRQILQDGSLVVDFEGTQITLDAKNDETRSLRLAYALTFHKTQGSEFPCAVVIVHRAHQFMHHRNLFYTGVTRAKERVIILGDSWSISHCATKREQEYRRTFLPILTALYASEIKYQQEFDAALENGELIVDDNDTVVEGSDFMKDLVEDFPS